MSFWMRRQKQKVNKAIMICRGGRKFILLEPAVNGAANTRLTTRTTCSSDWNANYKMYGNE